MSVRFEADHGPPHRDVPDVPVAVCDDKSRSHGHVLAFRDPYPNGEGRSGRGRRSRRRAQREPIQNEYAPPRVRYTA